MKKEVADEEKRLGDEVARIKIKYVLRVPLWTSISSHFYQAHCCRKDCGPSILDSWQAENHHDTDTLLTAITDNPEIQQALYPDAGANVSTSRGGGKPKTDYQWELCVCVFTNHPKYSASFALAKTKGQRMTWTNKIKNHLRRCVLYLSIS